MSARRRAAAAACALVLTACASRPVSRPVPPAEAVPGWNQEGLASWYGGDDGFEGKPTASGEIYDSSLLTAAHRDLPLGTIVDVENAETGKSVRVRINDRGPFVHGRVIDLSREAARRIDLIGPGVGRVRVSIVSEAPPAEPVSPTGLWAVQVGSFAETARAERQVERVRAAGFRAYLEAYQGLTRVKIGPLETRAEAETALRQAEAAGLEGIVVPGN